jgi:4-aminobutyrate aminotransferase/(S)-3-amino-2-methylpropionate transaminase
MVVPYTGYVEVCEALNRLTPGKFKKKSVLMNSGAEALENAVKIARSYTKRQAVVVFEHGYHGRTNLTMAMTAKNMPYKNGFGPFAPEVYRMPMAYPFRWNGDQAKCAQEALEIITHKIEKEIGAKNVAAIVILPKKMASYLLPMRYKLVLVELVNGLHLRMRMLSQTLLLPLRESLLDFHFLV